MKTRSSRPASLHLPASIVALLLLATGTGVYGQPVIINQPQTQAVAPGATALFTVGASGAEPLAFQWQRNAGAGFSDLTDCTNAVLTLTNVQSWNAWDYRVVVTDLSGTRTSSVAHLYVLSPGRLTNRVVLDNFDDNHLTGWFIYGPGAYNMLFETNQEFTVHGYWPGVRTTSWNTYCWGMKATNWTVATGQTMEWRADVARMNPFATAAEIVPASQANSVFYATHFGKNFITIVKWAANDMIVFLCDAVSLKHTNVVLSFSITRANPNAILTVRVLDKDQQNAVLYQRSVVDTPQADRSLSSAELLAVSGMNMACSPDVGGAPYFSGDCVGCASWQYHDGTSLAADVTYDNFEAWTYRVPVVHCVDLSSTSPTPPYTNWATAAVTIQDAVDAAAPGDEIIVTNGIYATGGRAVGTNVLLNRVAVDKPLTLRSVNGPDATIIEGYQVPGTTNGDGAIRCVYLADGASLSGFTLTNGATRTNGDYDFDQSGGGVYCESTNAAVSNCVLAANAAGWGGGGAYGGTLNNCTLSRNGALGEYCYGGGANNAVLRNCRLIGNSASYGGGASSSTLHACTLIGNSAAAGGGAHGTRLCNCTLTGNSAGAGGGVAGSSLNNCVLTGNTALHDGGGAYGLSLLNNCTLTGNSAARGGGAAGGMFSPWLNNCIVYFNTATNGPNYDFGDGEAPITLNFSCTTPLPTNSVGNITNAPLFVDLAGGNLRPQANSPCINAGDNSYLSDSDFTNCFDLDGNPRIVSGTVDIGAYEYQGTGSMISYAWLQSYGLPTDGSADLLDLDTDGHSTWQEWRCQTDPTNALSALRLVSASPTGTPPGGVLVTWQSVAGVNYFLERSTNLSASPPFSLLAPNLLGQANTTSFTDTNAAHLPPVFYRVGVGP